MDSDEENDFRSVGGSEPEQESNSGLANITDSKHNFNDSIHTIDLNALSVAIQSAGAHNLPAAVEYTSVQNADISNCDENELSDDPMTGIEFRNNEVPNVEPTCSPTKLIQSLQCIDEDIVMNDVPITDIESINNQHTCSSIKQKVPDNMLVESNLVNSLDTTEISEKSNVNFKGEMLTKNPFFNFVRKTRNRYGRLNPKEVVRRCALDWHNLPIEDKNVYKNEATRVREQKSRGCRTNTRQTVIRKPIYSTKPLCKLYKSNARNNKRQSHTPCFNNAIRKRSHSMAARASRRTRKSSYSPHNYSSAPRRNERTHNTNRKHVNEINTCVAKYPKIQRMSRSPTRRVSVVPTRALSTKPIKHTCIKSLERPVRHTCIKSQRTLRSSRKPTQRLSRARTRNSTRPQSASVASRLPRSLSRISSRGSSRMSSRYAERPLRRSTRMSSRMSSRASSQCAKSLSRSSIRSPPQRRARRLSRMSPRKLSRNPPRNVGQYRSRPHRNRTQYKSIARSSATGSCRAPSRSVRSIATKKYVSRRPTHGTRYRNKNTAQIYKIEFSDKYVDLKHNKTCPHKPGPKVGTSRGKSLPIGKQRYRSRTQQLRPSYRRVTTISRCRSSTVTRKRNMRNNFSRYKASDKKVARSRYERPQTRRVSPKTKKALNGKCKGFGTERKRNVVKGRPAKTHHITFKRSTMQTCAGRGRPRRLLRLPKSRKTLINKYKPKRIKQEKVRRSRIVRGCQAPRKTAASRIRKPEANTQTKNEGGCKSDETQTKTITTKTTATQSATTCGTTNTQSKTSK